MVDPFGYVQAQHIGTLTEGSFERWGDPVKNREKLVPYGFRPIDKAVFGIDPEGEFLVIQGREKGRKSTVLQNVVKNIMGWEKLRTKPVMVIDILESSSPPQVVKDNFICMLAAEYLMLQGHRSDNGSCKACGGKRCKELTLSSRSLRFVSRSPIQDEAIHHAISVLNHWNVYLFGPGLNEGRTRDLDGSIRRWQWLAKNKGASIFISDHVQQYHNANQKSGLSDYEKQQIVVPELSTFVGEHHKTVIALSQLSLATRKNKEGRQYAIGGAKMAAEANTVIQTEYDEDRPTIIGVQIVESRYSGKMTAYGRIDPSSGLIYGKMEVNEHPRLDERDMTAEEKKDSPYDP